MILKQDENSSALFYSFQCKSHTMLLTDRFGWLVFGLTVCTQQFVPTACPGPRELWLLWESLCGQDWWLLTGRAAHFRLCELQPLSSPGETVPQGSPPVLSLLLDKPSTDTALERSSAVHRTCPELPAQALCEA